ncbi:MAG: hypothetical protein AAF907_14230, partial [Planctomycetota bacterium]
MSTRPPRRRTLVAAARRRGPQALRTAMLLAAVLIPLTPRGVAQEPESDAGPISAEAASERDFDPNMATF